MHDILKRHESKFGKIVDSEGKEVIKIMDSSFNIDPETKFVNDE